MPLLAEGSGFPNFLQMQPRVPRAVWYVARVLAVLAVLALCVGLVLESRATLFLFWGLVIPVVPLLLLLAPGLWRNVCPLSAANQFPRLFGFSKQKTLPPWLQEYSYMVAISLLFVIVSLRKVVFNHDGQALAVLILAMVAVAFLMGRTFKGKSGWCSTICPVLPVQRLYGQTPFFLVRNSHCQECLGCAKNCYDFNPNVAYLADQYDENPYHRRCRKFFAGSFPGFIVAFYTLPEYPAIALTHLFGTFALYVLVSVGVFYFVDAFIKSTPNRITAMFGAIALNLYYWFNFPILAANLRALNVTVPAWWPIAGMTFVLFVTLVWIYRTGRKETVYVQRMHPERLTHLGVARLLRQDAASGSGIEVEFRPGDRCVSASRDQSLLEIAEKHGQEIEAGCRMGVCGADPVMILEGQENLSAIGDDERATLERLGLAKGARMACCARVKGRVCVSLKPERAAPPAAVPGSYDETIRRVVIVGNGIAGVTAADYCRRHHPKCEIDLIGRETHHLYNRMGISRLIYGRSAMQGLYLFQDGWYEQNRINCWLNTRVLGFDTRRREVSLGTGEVLNYDRLILAMGSRSNVPRIEGVDMAGSFVLREAQDAMRLRAYCQEHHGKHVVVAGGGLLGLEAAYALHKLGLGVTVLERSDRLLRRQLDECGAWLLDKFLKGLGIDVLTQAETGRLTGEHRVQQVELADGRTLPCDVFLVCAGIQPNTELARAAGLRVGRGVLVDDHMRTSAPYVFAVGDLAEFRLEIPGLWPSAVEQGRIAALNAMGLREPFQGVVPATNLKVAGIDLTSVGSFEPGSDQDIVIALLDENTHTYRKLVIADGRAVGAILIGYPELAPKVTAAIKKQQDVRQHLPALRIGDWEVLGAIADARQAAA